MTGYDSKMKDREANKVECTLAPFEKYRQYECRRVGNVVTVKRRENDHRHLFFLFVCSAHTHTTLRGSRLGCAGQRDKTEHPF